MTSTRQWTADDAVRVNAAFARWLTTPDAARIFRHAISPAAHLDPGEIDNAVQAAAGVLHVALTTEPVIWCDPAMVDLLAAASAGLPAEAGDEPLLLPPSGMAIFAKDLPVEWALRLVQDGGPGDVEHVGEQVRALSWSQFSDGVEVTLVNTWRAGRPGVVSIGGGDGGWCRVGELYPGRIVQFLRPDEQPSEANAGLLLRALSELSRHQVVRVDEQPSSKASRQAARQAGVRDASVRRLYLQRPEEGPAELDALRAERAGAPRAHWVRGHWKKQWYPSIEEHRWLWVHGYARGEGPLPTSQTPGVLIARGKTAVG